MNLSDIKFLCEKGNIIWSQHVALRCMQRGIKTIDIESAIKTGEIIEMYPNDYPYPSCLIFGITILKKVLHVVCGIGNEKLWIITAYYPDPEEWNSDLKTRKEQI